MLSLAGCPVGPAQLAAAVHGAEPILPMSSVSWHVGKPPVSSLSAVAAVRSRGARPCKGQLFICSTKKSTAGLHWELPGLSGNRGFPGDLAVAMETHTPNGIVARQSH